MLRLIRTRTIATVREHTARRTAAVGSTVCYPTVNDTIRSPLVAEPFSYRYESHAQSSSWPIAWKYFLLAVVSLTSAGSIASAEPQAQLPFVTKAEVEKHKSRENGIWVIYKDGVYDITKFIANHPGGRDKILLAAGGDIEPFWNIYRQHLNSALATELLNSMKIATLHPDDVVAMSAAKASTSVRTDDPYSMDPTLSPIMSFHQRQPINAEAPANLVGNTWITPIDMWFVRNHHPVPAVDTDKFRFDVVIASDLMGKARNPASAVDEFESSPMMSLSLADFKASYPTHTVVTSVQCGGNRRAEMTQLEKTNGASWNVSAMSTAQWTGVKLRDVLASMGVTEDTVFTEAGPRIQHVHLVGIDGMEASIPIRKALNRFGDVILAYEMNGEPLPPKHGFPLRAIVPGHVGVRNVKWVTKIRLSGEEAYGTWQRGMAYKGFGPSVKSLEGVDVEAIPSLQEQPVQSALTISPGTKAVAGDVFSVKGYAYSGGGRGIIRVDVSIDGGQTWAPADLTHGSEQPLDRAWAWTLWESHWPIPANAAGKQLEVICKATDASYNVQPDSVRGIWNLRGINNNAWHRLRVNVVEPEADDTDE